MTRIGVGLAILTMVFIGVWCGSCQEEQKTAPAGNAGLNQQTSLENTQLKTEMENLKKQIEDLKKQTEQQKQQIAQSDQKNQQMAAQFEQEKQTWQAKAEKEPSAQEKQQLAKFEEEKQKAEKRYNDELSALTKKNSELTAEIERQKAELATLKGEITAKPRHLGMVALVMVGIVTVLGVIIAAIIETGRADRENPPALQQTAVKPTDKKRG